VIDPDSHGIGLPDPTPARPDEDVHLVDGSRFLLDKVTRLIGRVLPKHS
jgi:hypothetical protein